MKRQAFLAAAILMVTLLLPWLAVRFVPGDADMAVLLILLYVLNPMLAVSVGLWARQWWWPVIVAVAFLLGAWLVFAPGELAFLLYASVYLVLGLAAMALARLVRK